MTRINRMTARITLASGAALLCCASLAAQGQKVAVNPGPTQRHGAQQWQSNKLIVEALSQAQTAPKTGATAGFADGSNSTLIGLLRQQSASAQALIGLRPGGQLGASHTMSASGNPSNVTTASTPSPKVPSNFGTVPQTGSLTPVTGPTKQRSPGATRPASPTTGNNATSSVLTLACMNGISSVDGQKSGVWFSPIAGPEGTFVIQGCGFGGSPGEIYLSGLHYQNGPAKVALGRGRTQMIGARLFPDRVGFQVTPNNWSDRQIVASIDLNASGLYDTNNVTLVVKTSTGQVYQATGFNFSAARETQVLASILKAPIVSGIELASITDSTGTPITPNVESPSVSFWAGKTIGVMRDRVSWTLPGSFTFPGGTDTYQFSFAPGFKIDPQGGVQLYHSIYKSVNCQSVNGQYSTNGNWAINYTSTSSFQVFWQEDSCWPTGNGGNPIDYGSVAAYALDITVIGPRGVSPW